MQTKTHTQAIIDAVKNTGDHFRKNFRKADIPQNLTDFMSALKAIEEQCFQTLKESLLPHYPDVPWVDDDEFDGATQQRPAPYERYWLCDTMDGAVQYLRHIPGWTINLVLIERGEPVLAILYDPLTNELFHAEKNNGAYRNGIRMPLLKATATEIMLGVLEYGHQLKTSAVWKATVSHSFTTLLEHFSTVRNYGPHGLQLAYVAAGRIDLFVQHDLDTHNWLAGLLVAKEAGATIVNATGMRWQWGDDSLLVGTEESIAFYRNNHTNK